jgi:phosphoribosylamine--glycine ligase
MKVFVLDTEGGVGLDFACRAAECGHDVRFHHEGKHPVGKGFPGIKFEPDWKAGITWAGKDGLVVPTGNSKFLRDMDRFRDFGVRIFGPTRQSAELEIDRQKGMDAMQAAGLDIPHYEMFDSLQSAMRYAKKSDDPLVFKPMGDEGDKALTHVADTPADMVGWLEQQIARGKVLKGQCMLQEKVQMCAEFGVSGWMGPEGFLSDKYQECFEFKRLMPGDIGPNTGEQGTVCKYVAESRLFDETLKPLEPLLRDLGHTGDIAIGVGIGKQGEILPFEFTARLGWPAFYIQCASHKGDCVQWMSDLLDGKDTLQVDYRTAIGVVLSQPPYPEFNGKRDQVEGSPITGIDEVWENAHPAMMMIGKGPNMVDGKVKDGPQYQTAGELVCVMTGLGRTVSIAAERVYDAIDSVKFAGKMYRNDIGKKLETCLPDVQQFGFGEGWVYE